MQSRRRRCRRTFLARIDRLVAVVIAQLLGNVRRQRHQTDPVQDVIDILVCAVVVGEADQAVSLLHDIGNLSREHPVSEDKLHANARALSGLDQRLPEIQFPLAQEQQFDPRLGSALHVAVKPCGNDLGIVDNQHVPRPQIVGQIRKMPMLDAVLLAIQHHQSRRVAPLGRVLCNQLGRKIIIEIRSSQRGFGQVVGHDIAHG